MSAFGARDFERLVQAEVAEWLKWFQKDGKRPFEDKGKDGEDSGREILHSSMPAVTHMDAALLVLDLVQSTHLICDSGDTLFSSLIGRIHRVFKKHESASELLFLKCNGDGSLAAYSTVPAAFSVASTFLEKITFKDVEFRTAIHWGRVKAGPGGDPLGAEVHRVFRMEALKKNDMVEAAAHATLLPRSGRILVSKQAWERMDPAKRALFNPVGTFRLKGFDEPCKLWVATAGNDT